MIVISGTVAVNPERRNDALVAALKMSKASEAEPGCITYRFYSDLEDANTFRIFEVWEGEAALQAHFQTAHIAEFNAKLPGLLAGEMDIKRYNVESVQDL